MSDNNPSAADPFGQIADEFVEAIRAGKLPSVEEFAQRYPEHAHEIREMLPALLLMEQAKSAAGPGRAASLETSAPAASPPGYELCEEIGHGGMGVVYRARDTALDRDVAVKLLSARYPADSPTAQRFLSEARITGQLQHPGIPAVHQVGTLTDGRPFLAMKLIKGSTLEAIMKQRPDPAAERSRLLAIFEAVCQSVGYAHAHRVIHRDLKPANVMVGAFGEVQVMDWGLAKVLGEQTPATTEAQAAEATRAWTEVSPTPEVGSHTQAGSLVGTPAFIAPEQAVGEIERVNERSDVFGLGALLAVILTGKPPYVGETAESVRVQAVRGKLEDCFARLDASGAEPELVALCKQCLAFEPADRPADAGTVALAVAGLRAAADERARRAELERVRVEGEQATALARSAERRKRRRLALAAAAVLALAVVGGLTAVLAVQRRANADLAAKNAELDDERQRAQASLYASRITLAESRLASADPTTPDQILAKCLPEGDGPDRRRWEWYYLNKWCHGELRRFTGKVGGVYAVAFSPDGRVLASAGAGNPYFDNPNAGPVPGEVILRDFASGSILHTLRGHPHNVVALAFSPDGKRIATGGLDNTVKVWDCQAGKPLFSVEKLHAARLEFLAGGRQLACWTGTQAHILSAETGRSVRSFAATRLAVSADRSRVACAFGNEISVYSQAVETLAHLRLKGECSGAGRGKDPDKNRPQEQGPAGASSSPGMAFASDGHRLFVVEEPNRLHVNVIDLTAGRQTGILDADGMPIGQLLPDPKGQYLAGIVGSRTIRIWEAASNKVLGRLSQQTDIRTALVSPDGSRIVTNGVDRVIWVWDVATLTQRAALVGHESLITDLAFSPDGRFLASGDYDAVVRIWDPSRDPRGQAIATTYSNDIIAALGFEPDSSAVRIVATAAARPGVAASPPSSIIETWDISTGRRLHQHTVSVTSYRMWPRADFAFSTDNRLLAAPTPDWKVAAVWQVDTGKRLVTLKGHTGIITSVVFSPDGRRIATADWNNQEKLSEIRLWDAAAGAEIHRFPRLPYPVRGLAISPNGRMVAAGKNVRGELTPEQRALDPTTVCVWNTENGERLQSLVIPSESPTHTGGVPFLAFSPDGTQLAAPDNFAASVFVWDPVSGKLLFKLAASSDTSCLAYSPDGSRLAAIGYDGNVHLWDAEFGQELLVLRTLAPPNTHLGFTARVAFSPDGSRIIANSAYGILSVFDAGPDSLGPGPP
jgi:WD40 repeat protein